jgi:hypothetical protein
MEIAFTEREMDVMGVLWDLGSATVAEVRERLADDLAYTTVLTVLRTLEEKGTRGTRRRGRRTATTPPWSAGSGQQRPAPPHAQAVQGLARAAADAPGERPRPLRRRAAAHAEASGGAHQRAGGAMISWIAYALALSALAGAAALAAEAVLRMYRLPTRWRGWRRSSCRAPALRATRPPRAPARAQAAVAECEPEVAVFRARRMPPRRRSGAGGGACRPCGRRRRSWRCGGRAWGRVLRRRRARGGSGRVAGVPCSWRHGGASRWSSSYAVIVVPRWTLVWGELMPRMEVRHEGWHIRARDPLLVLAATLAARLVPWNCRVVAAHRLRLDAAVEVDCDTRTCTGLWRRRAAYGELLGAWSARTGRASGRLRRVPVHHSGEENPRHDRIAHRHRAALAAGCGACSSRAGAAYASRPPRAPPRSPSVPSSASPPSSARPRTVPTVPPLPPTVNDRRPAGPIKISFAPTCPRRRGHAARRISFDVHTDERHRDIRVPEPRRSRARWSSTRHMLVAPAHHPLGGALPLRVQVQVRRTRPNGIATTTVTTVVDPG